MSSFNQVILMGNLTRDVEVRFTANNTAIGSFGMAVNESWKDAQGNKKERVTFVDCDAFGKTAETMKQYLSKGSPIMVVGKLRLDEWEDKNGGGKRSKIKVVVDSFTFVGGGKDKGDTPPVSTQARPSNRPTTAIGPSPIDDGDVPFAMGQVTA